MGLVGVAKRIVAVGAAAIRRVVGPRIGLATGLQIGLTAGLLVLGISQIAVGQVAPSALKIGENTKLNAGGMFTFGYAGDYGDAIPSSHGLTWGLDGRMSGYYYSPNFLSFSATPYYNQSRSDSESQSLTGASGMDGTANFFTGSNFPGSVSYHYDRNSTGTLGLAGQPNFTTIGKGQGFSINWSALLPNWPTLSVGYAQGDGSGNIYGTSEETSSKNKLWNVHSNYQLMGFRMNAFYTRNNWNSVYPEFLTGASEEIQESSGQSVGFGVQHSLPIRGSFFANYNRSSSDGNFSSTGFSANSSSYTDDIESAGANFHPTSKLGFNVSENYTSNLNGYLEQSLTGNGAPVVGVSLGTGAHSMTLGGGANYQFTNFLSSSAQATYYDQYYFGKDYKGTFVSGTLSYGKRLWDMFTFSSTVLEMSNGQGTNSVGFIGNVNFFRRLSEGWSTSGQFSYAQNVQTLLVTYTTSYYNYGANVHKKFAGNRYNWSAGFNGSHSGLTSYSGTENHSESVSTSFASRWFTMQANYAKGVGQSLLGGGTLQGVAPTPGLTDFVTFSGDSYGGGFSVQPLRRMVLAGSYTRSLSDTLGQTVSHNDTEVYNAQLQYHLRRIGLQAGYTRFSQGISALGTPQSTTSYFVGFSRWFDFF